MIDYHIHTVYSCDSHLEHEMVCNRAIELGFDEIAFTEHHDFDPLDEGYGFYDYAKVLSTITEMKQAYGKKLAIKHGVEITYQKSREQEISDFLEDKEYDFVVGSVHLVGSFDVSQDAGTEEFFKNRTREEAFLSYFEVNRSLVESGLFDCLGHFEMIRRYAINYIDDYSYEEYAEIIEEIIRLLVKKEVVLEVNTSGLRHLPKETYPRFALIERFLELGGSYMTIGSDSHLLEHIGYKIPETVEQLKQIGVTGLTIFDGRRKKVYDV